MKLIKAIILITFLTVTNFSCVQDDDFSIPESLGLEENQDLIQLLNQINNGAVDLMTISQVKSFFVNGEVTLIESNIAVKGYAVSSDMTGNFYKEFYMQDEPENPTAGIKVVLNQVDSYNQFNIGREVYIKLQNLYIGETNSGDGVIAIGGSINQYGDEVEEITENMAASSILRSSNTFDIIPLSLNLSEINDSHIGIFVTAQNAQFSNTLSGLTYVDPYDDYDTQRDLESCVDSGSIKVETSAYASFQDNLLPTQGSGTLSAVVTKSYDGDERVMMLNSTDDVTFNSSRCDPLFYDNFSGSLNNWYVKSVQGEQGWEITPYGNPAPSAKMSGFSDGSNANEDWLITKTIDLSSVTTASLTFQSVVRYNGLALTVHMSSDYNGGNPTSDGNWTELSVTLDTDASSWFSWTDSGNIDLSSVTGGNVYIAFKYVSTSSGSATYEIDNVLVIGE
jgi:hypothetical protein